MPNGKRSGKKSVNVKSLRGFTLIEIMVVMLVIGILVAIAVPITINAVDRARESALRENLHTMRKALDEYYADKGKYPVKLDVLVEAKYLRLIPVDSVLETQAATWHELTVSQTDGTRGIDDVKSTSDNVARDGSRYDSW